MILIGLTGKKRSGKDTVAEFAKDYFKYNHNNYNQNIIKLLSFAYPLKKTVCNIFCISMKTLEDNKDINIPELNNHSPRDLLKAFGDCSRNVRNDVFIHNMKHKIKSIPQNSVVIVTDVRFDDEAKFIHQNNGYVIAVNSDLRNKNKDKDKDTHITEKGIDVKYIDCMIYNNLTIDHLKKVVWNTLCEIYK